MSDAAITIFHNPACGTSRNTLALTRHSGVEPVIVEYVKNRCQSRARGFHWTSAVFRSVCRSTGSWCE